MVEVAAWAGSEFVWKEGPYDSGSMLQAVPGSSVSQAKPVLCGRKVWRQVLLLEQLKLGDMNNK